MDRSAIEAIREAAIVDFLNNSIMQFAPAQPVLATPSGFAVDSLEIYMPGRARFRGRMTTRDIGSFARYCESRDVPGSACFIDAAEMRATTVFNLGTGGSPGHADDLAVLQLEKTAELRALLAINGREQSQRDMAEFLEDWKDEVIAYDAAGATYETRKAVAAIRRLTVEAASKTDYVEADFAQSRSVLASVEAQSEILIAGFRFVCVPYDGLGERRLDVRLSIRTSGSSPSFVARIRRLERVEQEMAEEMAALVLDRLADTHAHVHMGTFKP